MKQRLINNKNKTTLTKIVERTYYDPDFSTESEISWYNFNGALRWNNNNDRVVNVGYKYGIFTVNSPYFTAYTKISDMPLKPSEVLWKITSGDKIQMLSDFELQKLVNDVENIWCFIGEYKIIT